MGLMLRSDQLGITSVIRDLALRPGCYETMFHFFRASSWSAADLRQHWFEIVLCHAPFYKVKGLTILIGDGVKQAKNSNISIASHVVQMIENGYQAAKTLGELEHYFLSVLALKRLNELNTSGSVRMDLVTKAKKPCIAYELPPARKPGRGRPAIKGRSLKLKELFTTASEQFKEITAILYGKCVAMGIFQMISLRMKGEISPSKSGM